MTVWFLVKQTWKQLCILRLFGGLLQCFRSIGHKPMVQFPRETKKGNIVNILQVPPSNNILGCLDIDHKRIRRDFVKTKERVSSRLAWWKARILVQAGKTVLIKSKISGILLFTMHGIKILNNIKSNR